MFHVGGTSLFLLRMFTQNIGFSSSGSGKRDVPQRLESEAVRSSIREVNGLQSRRVSAS